MSLHLNLSRIKRLIPQGLRCAVAISCALVGFLSSCSCSRGQTAQSERAKSSANLAPMPEGGQATSTQDIQGAWALTQTSDKSIKENLETPITLELDLKEGRAHGFAGCNRFFGAVTIDEERNIAFPNIATTRMACPDMTIEQAFTAALREVKRYQYDEAKGELQLFDASGQLRLRFEKMCVC